MNILFVCSRNKWRSRTAEKIFKTLPEYKVLSAGTERSAQIRISEKLLKWADIIFVMEEKHALRIKQNFNGISREKKLIVLEIEDRYKFMDPELIELLQVTVPPYLHNNE